MRAHPLFPIAALALALGCRSELKRAEAEEALKAQYPVSAVVRLPVKAGAAKGSVAAAELVTLKTQAEKSGWFSVQWTEEKGRVTVTLMPTAAAPKDLTPTAQGFLAPAAKVVYVEGRSSQTRGDEAHVTYRVRLEQPTDLYPLFELRHRNARLGAVADRHAIFRRTDGKWLLASTDEKYHKAEE